jgi:rsbT co-antagonist protein RsbR
MAHQKPLTMEASATSSFLEANDNAGHERKDALLAVLFADNPDGLVIADAQGALTMNPTAMALMGENEGSSPEEWSEKYGLYREDGSTRLSTDDLPLVRALGGESVSDVIIFCRGRGAHAAGIYISVSARPLAGGGALAVFRDVTERKQIADALAQRNAELAAREQENRELIARLRVAVDELSTPVLEIWDDVLALPVVGIVDTQRSAQMTERFSPKSCAPAVARSSSTLPVWSSSIRARPTASSSLHGRFSSSVRAAW